MAQVLLEVENDRGNQPGRNGGYQDFSSPNFYDLSVVELKILGIFHTPKVCWGNMKFSQFDDEPASSLVRCVEKPLYLVAMAFRTRLSVLHGRKRNQFFWSPTVHQKSCVPLLVNCSNTLIFRWGLLKDELFKVKKSLVSQNWAKRWKPTQNAGEPHTYETWWFWEPTTKKMGLNIWSRMIVYLGFTVASQNVNPPHDYPNKWQWKIHHLKVLLKNEQTALLCEKESYKAVRLFREQKPHGFDPQAGQASYIPSRFRIWFQDHSQRSIYFHFFPRGFVETRQPDISWMNGQPLSGIYPSRDNCPGWWPNATFPDVKNDDGTTEVFPVLLWAPQARGS